MCIKEASLDENFLNCCADDKSAVYLFHKYA